MSESDLQRRIQVELTTEHTRLWRNNVGQAWQGASLRYTKRQMIEVEAGDVVIRNGRPVRYGLCEGSSDLIGPHSVIVTPAMIGTRVAIFTALEIKAIRGRVSPEQARFIETVRGLGGVAGMARSVDEASAIINQR